MIEDKRDLIWIDTYPELVAEFKEALVTNQEALINTLQELLYE